MNTLQLTGQTVKGYKLIKHIAGGGFGDVYLAHQTNVNREVAVKVIRGSFTNKPEFIRRFEQEAQLVAHLEHLHIVPLYDYWRDPGGAYLIMRCMRGGSLRDALEDGPLDLRSCAVLVDQISAALSFAHQNHVIHRDIKPENILMDEDGNAYLADFGIAKNLTVTNADSGATSPDAIVGSLDYLSPEQARGEQVTPRTDIYSLGVVVYEMLEGKHPFDGFSSVERLYKHINEPLPYITNVDDALSDDINQVIQKATQKDPAKRYSNVLEFARELRDSFKLDSTELNIEETLTAREQEVLQCLINGLTNREIADKLFITESTVKWYNTVIFRKLGVDNRVQAALKARDLNLLGQQGADGMPAVISQPIYSTDSELINPYKGLRAFESADARDFFGRDELVQKLLMRMQDVDGVYRFLAVVGPSGSGKSSLVRAGLIPALWKGEIANSENWFIIDMIPGSHPLDKLEAGLIRIAPQNIGQLNEQLTRDERGLLRIADIILPKDKSELVIVIDQFEEIFTQVEDEDERHHLMKLLAAAVMDKDSRVRVVITLRADYYDRPLHYPEFGELIRNRMETILPLSVKGLERAIRGPAERVGVTFEQGLVEQIISAVNYQTGTLPLLQYALTELFERRQGRVLTHDAYREIGGAVGALANRADEIYESLTEEGQKLTHQMFMRLVTLGEGAEDTRRRVLQSELVSLTESPDLMEEIINQFIACRLLSLDRNLVTHQPTIELAHEAILREWNRLHDWINDSRTDLRLQSQLARLVADWNRGKQDTSYLLRGVRLGQFESWAETTSIMLTTEEKHYLQDSIDARAQREAEEQARQEHEAVLEYRAKRVFQWLTVVLFFATVIGAGLSLFAFDREYQAQVARDNERIARAEAEDSLQRTNAQRIGLESISLAQTNGDSELIALLAIRSVRNRYTPQGDFAVQAAIQLPYPHDVLMTQSDIGNSGLSLSPDGKLLAVGGLNDMTSVWDLETGMQIGEFEVGGHVAFLPDGKRLVTANRRGALRVWHIETGEAIYSRDDLGAMFTRSLVVWEARNAVVLGSGDFQLLLLDIDSWEVQTQLRVSDEDVGGLLWDLAVAPDGEALAVADGMHVSLYDVSDLSLISTFNAGGEIIQSVAFSPDGQYMVAGTGAGNAWVWQIANPEEPIWQITGRSEILEVAFSPDSKMILTSGSGTSVQFWDVETGQERNSALIHPYTLDSAIFSPDGQYVITAGQSPTIRIWNTVFQNPVLTIPSVTGANQHVFSPDGRYVAATRMNTLTIHDFSTSETITYNNDGMLMATSVTPDGRYFLLGDLQNGVIRLWDIENQVMLDRVIPTSAVIAMSMTRDGHYLASAGHGPFYVRDFETGEVVFSDDLKDVHWSIDFSPDDNYLLVATQNVVKLYDTRTWQEIWSPATADSGSAVAFSPEGNSFVIAGAGGLLRLWDLETLTSIRDFTGHTKGVNSVDFSLDGKWLVSGAQDGTVRIWDVSTGEELRRYTNPFVSHVVFSPDYRLVLIDDTTNFRLWQTDITTDIDYLCEQVTRDFTAEERILYEIQSPDATCP